MEQPPPASLASQEWEVWDLGWELGEMSDSNSRWSPDGMATGPIGRRMAPHLLRSRKEPRLLFPATCSPFSAFCCWDPVDVQP